MVNNPYEEKINDLVQKKINEIVVDKENFMLFREVYLSHKDAKKIVGSAELGGKIIYRLKDWKI